MVDRRFIERLIALDEDLNGLAPEFAPLFLNVSQVSGEELEAHGGPFGLLLRLVQQRKVRRTVFEDTLKRVVQALEEQPANADRDRWLSLLCYVSALIYHERDVPEREPMRQLVTDSVQNDTRRVEVYDMGKSIAEALKEEGRAEGAVRARRETLLEQLEGKFGTIPAAVRRRIEATEDVPQLKAWLTALIKARRLANVGIEPLE